MSARSTVGAAAHGLLSVISRIFKPSVFFPSITMGVIFWLIAIVIGASYSIFIFHGRLAGYVDVGIQIFLISAIIICLFSALFSSDAGVISAPQDTPMVIISAMVASMIALSPSDMSDHALFVTVLATMILSTILTGLTFFVIGYLRISILMRYIPYPVVGGILAGVGWLLVQGALSVATDMPLNRETWMQFFMGDAPWRWIPALVLASGLVLLVRRHDNVMILPVALILALAAAFLGQAVTESPPDLLPVSATHEETGEESVPLPALTFESIRDVDVGLVLSQVGGIMVMIVFSTLNLLAYVSGTELIFRRELDFNRELTVAGAANVVAGLLGGGMVAYPTLAYSALAHRSRGNGRLINIVQALMLLATLALGASAVITIPRGILGGALMFMGLSFLIDWLYDARKQMPRHDYFIIVVMMLLIAAFGLLWGVACGILISMAFFVLQYSQIHVVRHEYTGDKFRSATDRSPVENRLLRKMGQRIRVYRLQGYIFFGTGYRLYQHLRSCIVQATPGEIEYIVLDFRLVERLDISTVVDFAKLRQLAEAHGIQVILANAAPETIKVLQRSSLSSRDDENRNVFADLDHALEWCENNLLKRENLSDLAIFPVTRQFGSRSITTGLNFAALSTYLTRITADPDEFIARQGDISDVMFFIESGRVDILLTEEHDKPVRLRSISAGTIVGEVGFYLGQLRSASIVAVEATVLHMLDREALERMEQEDPDTAMSFHTFVSCILSERLIATNHMVESLID